MNILKQCLICCVLLGSSMTYAETFGARSCDEFGRSGRPYNGFGYDARRGHPSEFDPGPATKETESWLKLFGQIPNYRSVGKYVLNTDQEIFRWMMGPMWYRGRLGKDQVKVFVIGQEGAQDENITNRAFTGSTGTRVQKFLNHLGVYESYLFLNTFVYTLGRMVFEDGFDNAGQRITKGPHLKNYVTLEQVWESPIVQYRHALFDNVVKQNPNSLKLIIAVGGGANDSLATWINARSNNNACKKNDIANCDLTKFYKHFADKGINIQGDVKALRVKHPGAAKFGEKSLREVVASFDRAAGTARSIFIEPDPQEEQFANCNGGPLPARLSGGFRYGYAPIPFRDFSFGSNWRNGKAGTTSNRNGADKIVIVSEKGTYDDTKASNANKIMTFKRFTSPRGTTELQLADVEKGLIKGMKASEVAYEHPRYSEFGAETGDLHHVQQFDPGPATPAMAKALMAWPNFQEIDREAFVSDPSFGFGASYRGNTKNPKLVILADQMGHTDIFSTRALTGTGGQFLQAWLSAMELDGQYLILRSLPVDTLGVSLDKRVALATNQDSQGNSAVKTVKAVLNQLSGRQQVLVMGPVAKAMARAAGLKVQSLDMPNSDYTHVSNWKKVAAGMGQKLATKDLKTMLVIPRKDLPYSSRWWMGTTGDRGNRGEPKAQFATIDLMDINDSFRKRRIDIQFRNEKEAVEYAQSNVPGNYYRLEAPYWVKGMRDNDPRPLNDAEKSAADEALEFMNLK